jgi:uncharacterized BrkB/YihY/UPF0761 family membrane protein
MRTIRLLPLLAKRSVQEFLDDNCTQMAAAISYYVLFSVFPLLIFLVGIARTRAATTSRTLSAA